MAITVILSRRRTLGRRREREAGPASLESMSGRRIRPDLEELAGRAGRLPDRGPEEDLWSGIAGEIGADGDGGRAAADGVIPLFRRRWRVGVSRAVAAAALVAAGSEVRWTTLEATPRAVADLEARYREARDELDPATRRMLDRNLRLIDRAIAEAQRALSEHPESSYLHQHLTQNMRRKAEFLSVAVRMTETD